MQPELVSCPLALLEAAPALEEAELPLAPHAAWLGFGDCGPFQGIISLLFMSIIAAFCVLGSSAGSWSTGISSGFTFYFANPLRPFHRQMDQKTCLAGKELSLTR